MVEAPQLAALLAWVEQHPFDAVALTRIKSSHAMTPRHALNVMLLAKAWTHHSHKLGAQENHFAFAALFHDLGHWRPDELAYVYDMFTHDQCRKMRHHTEICDPFLKNLNPKIETWIHQHHEQPDGKGYPQGLTDSDLLSQALRMADCFEGLTTPRRFRPAYSFHEALMLMVRWAGSKLSPGLFQSFRKFLGTYPIGSFVRISSGAGGIALPGSYPDTHVLLLTNREGDPLEEPQIKRVEHQDLSGEGHYWYDAQLPEPWKGLRPDLLGLPKSYF